MSSSASDGNGAYLTAGGTWTSTSDRNKKENFSTINEDELLNKVLALPITRWNYKGEAVNIQHIGPMAQDFYKAFMLNNDSLGITTIDEGGVAFAAIQALNQKLETENGRLKSELAEIQQNEKNHFDSDEKRIVELESKLNSVLSAQASIK